MRDGMNRVEPCTKCGIPCLSGPVNSRAPNIRRGEHVDDGTAVCDPCYEGKPRPATGTERRLIRNNNPDLFTVVVEHHRATDPDFEADVDQVARAIGPPPGPDAEDDSGYLTAKRVDNLLAAGKLREAAVLTAGKQLADSWPRQRRRPTQRP